MCLCMRNHIQLRVLKASKRSLKESSKENLKESLKRELKREPKSELKRDGNSRGPLFQEDLSIGGGGAMHAL